MLSKRTKYAINALVYLAKHKDQGPVLIGDISLSENIPKKFLEAILLQLKNAGILNSKQGKGGGYYLNRKPKDINLAEVVRLFDGAIGLIPCVTMKYYQPCDECPDERFCGIRSVFQEVRDHTVMQLKKSSLEEVVKREEKLKRIRKKSS